MSPLFEFNSHLVHFLPTVFMMVDESNALIIGASWFGLTAGVMFE